MRALGAEGDSSDTANAAIKATRKGGNVALIGDFFFTTNNFPIGMLMEKAITLRGGQLYAEKVRHSCPSAVIRHKKRSNENTAPPNTWPLTIAA
jgi:threonine dehydrogenase-like Zn-dependent dehydrogenase